MAEAVLSAFIQVLLEKLTSSTIRHFGLSSGVKSELHNLQSTLSTIEGVLADAESRKVKEKALIDWLGKLRHAAFDADDILDEFATEALRRKVEIEEGLPLPNHLIKTVRNFFSPSNPLAFQFKMGRKLRKTMKRLDALAAERSKFHLKEVVVERNPEISEESRQTHSFVIESEVYGREGDKAKLVDMLINNSNDESDVSIISVVGMGGLGKTTLAQLVYNVDTVNNHFEARMWVCVSDQFDIRRIIKEILESANINEGNLSSMDILQSRLRKELNGRRYLLVLDDVWNEDQGKWSELKILLSGGAKGSKIIVTTRSEKVAMVMCTHQMYKLAALSWEDCWFLFKNRAFGVCGEEETPQLVAIGQEIVTKCRGVPLAAKALGSLMCFKRGESEWSLIKESEIWNLPTDENGILPALRLSYDHLPLHLKQCFAYCAIFPKDYEVEKDTLVKLWMAEGFLESSTKSMMAMEDLGNIYFRELLWRSFFQDVERDEYGNIAKCKMHDLICDLAKSVSEVECFEVPRDLKELREVTRLRTSLLFGRSIYRKEISWDIFFSFKCLRVLDLSLTNIKSIPNSIGKLKRLRYLDLSETSIEKLPEAITELYNLQTLKLLKCESLRELPKGLRKMISLRNLEIELSARLKKMPIGIGRLRSLRILTRFIVNKESGRGIEELQDLKLQGDLRIEKLEKVRNIADAKKANLIGKEELWFLHLSWSKDVDTDSENDQYILEGLQPHKNLKKLLIENYQGLKFPSWMMVDFMLSNLVEIKIVACRKCEQIPPFGQLCFLKVLSLEAIDKVKYLSDGTYGAKEVFPLLEELELSNMPNLVSLCREVEEGQILLPSLKKLTVWECPKLTSLPRLPSSLTTLLLVSCDESLLNLLDGCSSLSHLYIGGFPELELLPEWLLRNHTLLNKLELLNFPKLRFLPKDLQKLTALNEVLIFDCDKVSDLLGGLQGIPSLRSCIITCKDLTSLPNEVQGLDSLTNLSIVMCENMVSMGEGLRRLSTLQDLSICRCLKLESLPEWLVNLPSLQVLEIKECPALTCLPEDLSTLNTLWIEDCPQLQKRYQKGRGKDWTKIQHIPDIFIDGLRV